MKFPAITETFIVGTREFAVFGLRDITGVGLYFKNEDDNNSDRQEMIKFIEVSDHLILKREPENEYDTNAIAIFASSEETPQLRRVGYVPKEIAIKLAALIDKHTEWSPIAWVTKTGDGKSGKYFCFKIACEKKIADKLLYAEFMGEIEKAEMPHSEMV